MPGENRQENSTLVVTDQQQPEQQEPDQQPEQQQQDQQPEQQQQDQDMNRPDGSGGTKTGIVNI